MFTTVPTMEVYDDCTSPSKVKVHPLGHPPGSIGGFNGPSETSRVRRSWTISAAVVPVTSAIPLVRFRHVHVNYSPP